MGRHLPPRSAVDAESALTALRLQAAVVRALLDEVDERVPSPDVAEETVSQLSEELARLGREALSAARAIARAYPSTDPVADDVEQEPTFHWLPIIGL